MQPRFHFTTLGDVVRKTGENANTRNITIIAAMASNNGIGFEGKIPWDLKEDMRQFARLTKGHVVIMGRVTQESLPFPGYLKERLNIVITRRGERQHPLVTQAGSLEEALEIAGDRQIFIIGGEELYKEAMPFADDMILTKLIDFNPEFDRQFPPIGYNDWAAPVYTVHQSKANPALHYSYWYYNRRPSYKKTK